MSSKSRHQHQPRKPKHTVEHVDGGEAHLPSLEDFDEIVHVPEGRSRVQFYFLIGLMIFLLIVFIVPAAFQNALTGGGQREQLPAVTWETGAGEFAMTPTDFIFEKRREDSFRRTINPYMRSTPSSAEVATTLLIDQLSKEAGVYVSNAPILTALQGFAEQLGGIDQYKAYMSNRYPGGAPAFEEALRRAMRSSRYLELVGRLGAKPSADEIESTWIGQHKEYAFDYIEAPASAFEEAALADVPDDATLEAWWAERPDWERNALKTEKAWRLASAYVELGAEPPAALLERYPLPEGFDAEAEGVTVYNKVSFLAYALDEPRLDDEGNKILYIPKEELTDELARSAKTLTAMNAWRADLKERMDGGAAVDVAAEAAELGLTYVEGKEARDHADLIADNDFGGSLLAAQLGSAATGDVLAGVILTGKMLEVVKVVEIAEPVMPPFPEIRETVAEKWSKEHAAELAQAYLEAKVEAAGSPETLDAESFAALAEGDDKLTLGLRDWMDLSAPNGPNAFEPASLFIRIQAQTLGLYELEEGGLAAPTISSGKDRVYLVRSLGSRERDFSEATPAEIDVVQNSLEQAAMASFRGSYSSTTEELPEFLVKTYKLALPDDADRDARQAEERALREKEAGQAPSEETVPEG
jgi:hypothetical protein